VAPSTLRGSAASSSAQLHRRWEEPAFFDAFSVGESTFNYDGAQKDRGGEGTGTYREYVDGYNPQIVNAYEPDAVPPVQFQESESAGAQQAFQSFYPGEKAGPGGRAQSLGEWQTDSGTGDYTQQYQYPAAGETQLSTQRSGLDQAHASLALGAAWFDASVKQIDGYGRPK
ncbi:unnamed protein product, partial [Polarella glacialis]